ncbi:MAG: hypothetical protein QM523_11330, partial [Candidatus Pacebacteria bacterium]|nr:hypothetical protein [Candidatus Paceibacterota bacterium]
TNSGNLTNLGNLTIQTGGGNYYQTVASSFTNTSAVGVSSIVINLGSGRYNDHANGATANFKLTADRNLSLTAGSSSVAISGTVIDIGNNWYGRGDGIVDGGSRDLTIDNTGVKITGSTTNLLPATVGGRDVAVARVNARKNFQVTTAGAVFIEGVNNNAGSNLLVYNLERITGGSIVFGDYSYNDFGNDLSLNATSGDIRQGAHPLLLVGKVLSLSASGYVGVYGLANSIGSLGSITAGGIVTVRNNGNLGLTGNISAAGAITIDLTINNALNANGNLTLLKNITTSGGAVTLNLGVGIVTGAGASRAASTAIFNDGGFSLDTSGNDLTISLGKYNLTAATSFIMGAGQFRSAITLDDSSTHSLTSGELLDGSKVSFTAASAGKIARNRILIDKPITISGLTYGYDLSIETTSAGANIFFSSTNSFTSNLNLIANDGINQSPASQVTVTGTFSAATSGAGTFTLGNTSNSFGTIGILSNLNGGSTLNSIDLYSTSAMTLTDTITADGTITLQSAGLMTLSKSGGLTLTSSGGITLTSVGMTLDSAVTSSGGLVTINTGTGTYDNLNGVAATRAGNLFTTSNNGLNITAASITVGAGTVFDLGSPTSSFINSINLSGSFDATKTLYFADMASNIPIAIRNDTTNNAVYSSADINGLTSDNLVRIGNLLTKQAVTSTLPTNAKVNFYGVSYSAAVTIAAADTVKFWGTNSFTSLT